MTLHLLSELSVVVCSSEMTIPIKFEGQKFIVIISDEHSREMFVECLGLLINDFKLYCLYIAVLQ